MADEPEQKMTVRERRAQRAKANAVKTAPGKIARKAIVPAIILLVIAGIAAGFYFTNKAQGQCPGHWHATFDLYVQNNNDTPEHVSFVAPQFDLNGQTPFRSHMHQNDHKNQWHFEQGGQCVGVQEAIGYLDVDLKATSIKLSGVHENLGQAGTYHDDATHNMTVYVEHVSDRHYEVRNGVKVIVSETLEWRQQSVKSILDYQLKDGERILILHGNYTPDQVEQMKAAMALPDTGRPVAS